MILVVFSLAGLCYRSLDRSLGWWEKGSKVDRFEERQVRGAVGSRGGRFEELSWYMSGDKLTRSGYL